MRVVFVNGHPGVGRHTTVDAISMILQAWEVDHALVDLDGLGRVWPAPHDDPHNTRASFLALAALADTYRSTGSELLVVAGTLADTDERERCEAMTGVPMTVVRLRPYADGIREQFRRRRQPDDESSPAHPAPPRVAGRPGARSSGVDPSDTAGGTAAGDDVAGDAVPGHAASDDVVLDDAVVDVGGEPPLTVAQHVLAAAGVVEPED